MDPKTIYLDVLPAEVLVSETEPPCTEDGANMMRYIAHWIENGDLDCHLRDIAKLAWDRKKVLDVENS